MDEDKQSARELFAQSGLLLAVITATAGVCFLVSARFGLESDARCVALATLGVAVALIPPLWLEAWMGFRVAGPLATMMWRLGVLLPLVLYANYKIEPARNCFQVTLLACYLMSLPLESWLLIRQSRP